MTRVSGSEVEQNSWSADLRSGSLPVGQAPCALASIRGYSPPDSRACAQTPSTRRPAHGPRRRGCAPDADLHEHAGFHQALHRKACGLERPPDKLRCRGRREHGSGGQSIDQKADRRVSADAPYPTPPTGLQLAHPVLEITGVLHRPVARRGEERDPAVDPDARPRWSWMDRRGVSRSVRLM